jgi:hypothetical protein
LIQETNGAVTKVKWNHRKEEGSQRFVRRNEATTP